MLATQKLDLQRSLTGATPAQIRKALDRLSDADAQAILYDWAEWRRPEQALPPGDDWLIWLIRSGRGWGKTRTGAETVRYWVESGQYRRLHLVARTASDVRDTMVEGESGILAISPPWFRPDYEPAKRRLTWPNGAVAITFSAEKPDALRGPQCDGWWADEVASWRYMTEAWDQLQFGARLGSRVRGIITTTPRPVKLLKQLVVDPTVHETLGGTFDNIANLAPTFIARMRSRYEGTRLGRQELYGEILDDNPHALWQRKWIDDARVATVPPLLQKIVVAIDPAITDSDDSNDTGIVVAGRDRTGEFCVLDDVTIHGTPRAWAQQAIAAYHRHEADHIVAETNQGGDMVVSTIRAVDANVPVVKVTASRGKKTRAEPVSAKYEQGLVHHVGFLPDLEDQLCEWDPSDPNMDSPDRLDALVWAISDLLEGEIAAGGGWDVSPG